MLRRFLEASLRRGSKPLGRHPPERQTSTCRSCREISMRVFGHFAAHRTLDPPRTFRTTTVREWATLRGTKRRRVEKRLTVADACGSKAYPALKPRLQRRAGPG